MDCSENGMNGSREMFWGRMREFIANGEVELHRAIQSVVCAELGDNIRLMGSIDGAPRILSKIV